MKSNAETPQERSACGVLFFSDSCLLSPGPPKGLRPLGRVGGTVANPQHPRRTEKGKLFLVYPNCFPFKSPAALAVLLALAGAASAADVSVYGVVDTGLLYTSRNVILAAETNPDAFTGGRVHGFEMQSGYNSSSRIGLKGSEDLGNGLKASFVLENGLFTDDGSMKYDRLFGREALLGLSGEFGTVAFGRTGGVASAAGSFDLVYLTADAFDGGDNLVFGMQASDRYDNTATYQTPKFAGLQGTVQYSFKTDSLDGEGTEGTSKADRYASIAFTGEFGALNLVGAYELTKYANTDRADDTNAVYLGGNYDLGFAKVFLLAQYTDAGKSFASFVNALEPDAAAGFAGAEHGFDNWGLHVGAIVPVAGGDLTAGVYYVDGETAAVDYIDYANQQDLTYLGLSARYVYPLSKRTSLYAGAGWAREEVTSTFSLTPGGRPTPSYRLPTDKNTYTQAYAGVTHTF